MEPDVFFGKKPFCRLKPPEETDQKEGDDDCMGSAPVKDVSGTLEVHWHRNEEEDGECAPALKRAEVTAIKWKTMKT
ncbi:hypothetical protein MRX96_058850 [Rhipicephalus microplus]